MIWADRNLEHKLQVLKSNNHIFIYSKLRSFLASNQDFFIEKIHEKYNF